MQKKKEAPKNETVRPTIPLQTVMISTDTTAFSGWGPKVSGVGNILKNWN